RWPGGSRNGRVDHSHIEAFAHIDPLQRDLPLVQHVRESDADPMSGGLNRLPSQPRGKDDPAHDVLPAIARECERVLKLTQPIVRAILTGQLTDEFRRERDLWI